MEQRKTVGTFVLASSLPALLLFPGVSEYPMTAISAVLAMLVFINLPGGEPDHDELVERSKAVSCPAGVEPC